MANTQKADIKRVTKVLKYDAARNYIASFSPKDLSEAVGRIKRSTVWAQPTKSDQIKVGEINGDVICNALWAEMRYNPIRWGFTSPFVSGGANNLFAFCKMADDGNNQKLDELRQNLRGFMNLNALPNGAWNDRIFTAGGSVTISMDNYGHMDSVYHSLAKLRDCVKVVTKQNIDDVNRGGVNADIIIANVDWYTGYNGIKDTADTDKREPVAALQMTIYDEINRNEAEKKRRETEQNITDAGETLTYLMHERDTLGGDIDRMRNWININRSHEQPADRWAAERELDEVQSRYAELLNEIQKQKVAYLQLLKSRTK